MELDASAFDTAYEAFAEDIICRLKKTYPKYTIEIIHKHPKLEDDILIFINDIKFNLDLMQYIYDCSTIGEHKAYYILKYYIHFSIVNSRERKS